MPHQFQLMLQFRVSATVDFAKVLRLEQILDSSLKSGRMDGNEVGRDFVRFCIITAVPADCFSEVIDLITPTGVLPERAVFSDLEDGDTDFTLLSRQDAAEVPQA